MELDISAQHTDVHPRWRAIIERRTGKLDGLGAPLLRLHVTLLHSPHHLRGDEEVRLVAALPRRTLTVHKKKASMGDAIHAAFTALERELEGQLPKRRDSARRASQRRVPRRPETVR
jgi:ribosome-associated translation inhibitor RaiA